jgi:ParB family chromosome partitioning protein
MAKDGTSKAAKRSPRLGRGLSSLITGGQPASDPEAAGTYAPADASSDPSASHGDAPAAHAEPTLRAPLQVPLDRIAPNPHQPRRDFDEDELAGLASSIRQQGLLQPLVVTPAGDDHETFTLIAGERRLRAARLAGLDAIPCVVREADQRQLAEWALVENLQRSDLNPIERAEGYRQYMSRFDLSQAQAAERLGQPRTTIANHLRILGLHSDVQSLVRHGSLSFGHAKVLAGLAGSPDAQADLATRAAEEGWSVRQLEDAIAARESDAQAPSQPPPSPASAPAKAPHIRDLEDQLSRAAGTRVRIRPGRGKNRGRIVIDYYSLDDFDRIAEALGLVVED